MKKIIARFFKEVATKTIAFLLTVIIRLLQRTSINFAHVLSSMPKGVKEYWLYLNVESFEEKAYEYDYEKDCLGHVTYVEQYELNDYLESPGDYDLGYSIQSLAEGISDDRAEEINDGAALTEAELAHVEFVVVDAKNESDSMMSYVGYSARCGKQSIYVLFEGQSQGQGGIYLRFFDIYCSRYDAEIQLKQQKHFWD